MILQFILRKKRSIFVKLHFTVLIELDEPTEWIKFNVDQVGYYRVNYRLEEWRILCSLLRDTHKVNSHTLPHINFLSSL